MTGRSPNAAGRRPATGTSLLDILKAPSGPPENAAGSAVVLLPASPSTSEERVVPRPARPLRKLMRPLMAAARLVLRSPRLRQLALRILKRSPALYERAYKMVMASGSAPAATRGQPANGDVAALSPRANAILRVLRTLDGGTADEVNGRCPRLAFVSPLPPQRSGIATYATELLTELTAHADIELVAAQDEVRMPPSLAHLPVRSAAWFLDHGAAYDQVLYQLGNSPLHSHMFALMARHPGVVVLHDFFLGGALVHAQMSGAAPHAWLDALFHAHGYLAVRASEAAAANGQGQVHKDWPGSLPVIEGATRTIVHSQHARQLAADWYGPGATRRIDVIPHPRTPPASVDRAGARAALGIAPDCFLVCSFGFVAPHKLTHELLRAWTASSLHANRDCALILVGANHDSPYGVEVEALIRRAGPRANIRIAGWTDDDTYRQYLQAADVGVQLRTNAQGESSGAVLDCMNYGLATIVNANGSMAEFPDDAVWRLPDVFGEADLGAALETLHADAARRQALGERAVALLNASFRPAKCSRQYLDTLAQARAESAARRATWREALAKTAPADEMALQRLAARLAQDETPARRQLLVDVSDWARPGAAFDALAAAQLRELLAQDCAGLRVEPVYLDGTGGLPCYRQARNAVGRLLGLGWPVQDEPVVDVHAGDIYYAPDAASRAVAAAGAAGLLAAWQARGVTVSLLVRTPDDIAAARAAGADRLLCTSDAVARQLAHA